MQFVFQRPTETVTWPEPDKDILISGEIKSKLSPETHPFAPEVTNPPTSDEEGAPFVMFLDEMGYYLPAIDMSSLAVISPGLPGPGKSALPHIVPSAVKTRKLVTVIGPSEVLNQWCQLQNEERLKEWQAWIPELTHVLIDEEAENGVQLSVTCFLTCEELKQSLSKKFPSLSIFVESSNTPLAYW